MRNKSLHLLFVLVLFTIGFSYSQDAKFEWGHNSASPSTTDECRALALDGAGNIYHAGSFSQSLDADPGVGVTNLTSSGNTDCFIRKLDVNQNLLWARSFGGNLLDEINDVTCDHAGNVICIGDFRDSVDFDPGPSEFNLFAQNKAFFVLKLDSYGNFMWAFSVDYINPNLVLSVSCDDQNNIFLGGMFRDSIDFDPSASQAVFYSSNLVSGYIAKYDALGNYIYAKTPTGGNSSIVDIKVDNFGNVVGVGAFTDTVDFDPGVGVDSEVASISANSEPYVWKLDGAGNYLWSSFFKNGTDCIALDVETNNNGDVFVSGTLKGTIDFDPGPLVNNVTSYTDNGGLTYQLNPYLVKLNSSGDGVWANIFLGASPAKTDDMAVDGQGDVYLIGEHDFIYDFDPSPTGVYTLYDTGSGGDDVYIVKIADNSDFVWAKQLAGDFYTRNDIEVDTINGFIYCSGTHNGSVDLNPGYSNYVVSTALVDYYLLKLEPCVPSHYTDTVTVCSASSYQWINGKTYTSNNNTDHYVLEAANGCDSIVRLNLTFGSPNSSVTSVATCDSFTWTNGITYTSSTNVSEVFQNVSGCDSTSTLSLTIYQSTTGTDVVQACGQYTWIDGNTYTSNNNTAQHILSNSIGCDSLVTLDLTFGTPNSGTDVISACESYTWIDGNTYTSSNNTATYVLPNMFGCDSTVTLDLTINTPNQTTDQITACFEYTWINGVTYYSDNDTSTVTLTNAFGCDSIVTLDLTINSVNTTITNNDPELIAPSGMTSYQWLDCDNNFAQISGETSATFIAQQNGLYAVEIDDNGCVDTSACQIINQVGIFELGELNWTVYPNPTTDKVTIEFHELMGELVVEVVNPLGQLIDSTSYSDTKKLQVNLGSESGLYFVTLRTALTKWCIPIVKI